MPHAISSCCAKRQLESSPHAYQKSYSDRDMEYIAPSSTRARMRPSTTSMTEEQLREAEANEGRPRRQEAAVRELQRRGL